LLHAIGGTEDHIHLAVTVPPTLLASDWIGELKGASAHYVNHALANRKVIEWQSGYGVVSFGEGNAVGGSLCREPARTSRQADNLRALGACRDREEEAR
jgi:hypothetical protein